MSSDIWRVHSVPGGEPVVLFKRGAVRLLDSLLSAPQQPIEEILSQEETIWSVSLYFLKIPFLWSGISYLQKCGSGAEQILKMAALPCISGCLFFMLFAEICKLKLVFAPSGSTSWLLFMNLINIEFAAAHTQK